MLRGCERRVLRRVFGIVFHFHIQDFYTQYAAELKVMTWNTSCFPGKGKLPQEKERVGEIGKLPQGMYICET